MCIIEMMIYALVGLNGYGKFPSAVSGTGVMPGCKSRFAVPSSVRQQTYSSLTRSTFLASSNAVTKVLFNRPGYNRRDGRPRRLTVKEPAIVYDGRWTGETTQRHVQARVQHE